MPLRLGHKQEAWEVAAQLNDCSMITPVAFIPANDERLIKMWEETEYGLAFTYALCSTVMMKGDE